MMTPICFGVVMCDDAPYCFEFVMCDDAPRFCGCVA